MVYSPYPQKEIINESIVTPEEFDTVPSSFSDKDGYKYKTLEDNSIWENSAPADFEESCKTETDEHFVYARLPMITNNIPLMAFKTPADYFLSVESAGIQRTYGINGKTKRYWDGVSILITGDILAKTVPNPYSDSLSVIEVLMGNHRIVRHDINYTIQCGDYYYNQLLNRWSSTPTFNNYITTTNNNEYISNVWVPMGINGGGLLARIYLPSTGLILVGDLQVTIWSNTRIQKANGELLENNSILDETWLKNIAIKLVNIDGTEINDTDTEYIGLLDPLYANQGETITLKTGTQGRFSDRAKIMQYDGSDYSDILEWTRDSQTYKIEELLLNSLCSNHQANYVTLTNMNLKNAFSFINVLTDSSYLTTEKLMVKSANINFAENVVNCNLVEISQDTLDIVKTE